jgi:hypothetical protein
MRRRTAASGRTWSRSSPLILTDVPIPIPVDRLTTWKELCDYGPLDALVTRGIVPLDYVGMVDALSQWFGDCERLKKLASVSP